MAATHVRPCRLALSGGLSWRQARLCSFFARRPCASSAELQRAAERRRKETTRGSKRNTAMDVLFVPLVWRHPSPACRRHPFLTLTRLWCARLDLDYSPL
jgi:hypothetical protein